jgi:hypothetical protein
MLRSAAIASASLAATKQGSLFVHLRDALLEMLNVRAKRNPRFGRGFCDEKARSNSEGDPQIDGISPVQRRII